MKTESDMICLCNLEGTIDSISRKWAIFIISTLGYHGAMRFNELMDDLKGISPKTLAVLLKNLQKDGLIQREYFAEIPPRVEYRLTEDGRRLRESLIPLLKWAEKRDEARQIIHTPRCLRGK